MRTPARPVAVLQHALMRDVTAIEWKRSSRSVLAIAIPGAVMLWHTELDIATLTEPRGGATHADRLQSTNTAAANPAAWAMDDLRTQSTPSRPALGASVALGACIIYPFAPRHPLASRAPLTSLVFNNTGGSRFLAVAGATTPLTTVFDVSSPPCEPESCVAQLVGACGTASVCFTADDTLLVRAPNDEPRLLVSDVATWATASVRLPSAAVTVAPCAAPTPKHQRVAVLLPRQGLTVLELTVAQRPAARFMPLPTLKPAGAASLHLSVATVLSIHLSDIPHPASARPLAPRRTPAHADTPALHAVGMVCDLMAGGKRVLLRMRDGEAAVLAVDLPSTPLLPLTHPKPVRRQRAEGAGWGDRAPAVSPPPAAAASDEETDGDLAPADEVDWSPRAIEAPCVIGIISGNAIRGVGAWGLHDHRDPAQSMSLLAAVDEAEGCVRYLPLLYHRDA
jgi:hypothetical protein